MALPAGLSTVTVTGTYQHPDGTPFTGRVLFQPEPAILTSGAYGTLLLGTIEAVLDTTGTFTATLLATDDPDVTPVGWTYRVAERLYCAPGRDYPLSLPAAAPTVDIADVAPTAPSVGEYVVVTGPQPALGAAGAGDDIALRSTDPSTTNARTPTAHAASHGAIGTDPITVAQSQVTGLAAALAALLALTGGTLTGDLTINGANLIVKRADGTGAYRLRTTGGGLDLEIAGLNVFVSAWENPDFTGAQSNIMRWEPAGPHLIGRVQIGTSPFDEVHHIDASTGVAALGARNGLTNIRLAGLKPTAGAPTTGTWDTGDVILDAAGAWHLCTAGGTPGTWT